MPLTVRIPELPPKVVGVPLALDDRLPAWIKLTNKTRYVELQDILALLTGGPGDSHPPVINGGNIIHIVTALESANETGKEVHIPAIAGFDFLLRRGGQPLIAQEDPARADAEYEVLDAGGFKLLQPDDVLFEKERFELEIYALQGGIPGSGTISGGAFITGVVDVSTNITLDVTSQLKKLIRIRATTAQITLTLPSVADIPENTIIPIETTINNDKENKIQTSGGQFIYLNNYGRQALYMRPGETLWLFRYSDGFYVINDFYQNYRMIGKPFPTYKLETNELALDGATLLRADYPRLWEYVQSLGSSLVTDILWALSSATQANGEVVQLPYRGCFSLGNGTTTFRLPDYKESTVRGLRFPTSTDDRRYYNHPGGFQPQQFLSHTHQVQPPDSNDQTNHGKTTTGNSSPEPPGIVPYPTGSAGGSETRMDNIGMYWAIRV